MLSFLLSLLPSALSTINGITNAIANERIALINSKTDQERIASLERIGELQARQNVLIADASHSSLDLWIRSLIALGPTAFLLKIFIWDKVLQSVTSGSTPAIDANLWGVITAVLGFYFLSSAAIGIAKIIKA